jgi:tRNA (guanine10-N2)-dimethyltransferase
VKKSEAELCLFILSGEHATLPRAELCAILEAEGHPFKIGGQKNRLLLVEVNPQGAIQATQRAALVNTASIVLFEVNMLEQEILHALKEIDFTRWLQPNARFGVKVTRLQREVKAVDIDTLQAKIGSKIWSAMKGKVEVELTSPDIWFLGVINGNRFFFGPFLAARDRKGFFQRRSPLRPFFVPSAIHPKIARVMVNLSRAAAGGVFFDPFCGTGGLLLEAAGIGCIPIGVDIDVNILSGCIQNLSHYKTVFNGTLSDARNPPMCSDVVDIIATDPPYGRSSSTKGDAVTGLIRTSLMSLTDILKPGGYLCFALPLKFFKEEIIPRGVFSVVETHTMRIHRSLNRHIAVLKRR